MRGVDIFSGCGGLSLGFIHAGIEIVAASDLWAAAARVYRHNIKGVDFILSDVNSLDLEKVKSYEPDIIIGGPPCQDFSPAGKRNSNGIMADLTYVYAKIVSSVAPQYFVLENVPQIEKSGVFLESKKLLKGSGYGLSQASLNAAFYGVPQNRQRLFLIGRIGEKDGFLDHYLNEKLTAKPMTLREYFCDKLGTEFYYRHPRTYGRRAIYGIDEPSPTIRGVNRPIPKTYRIHKGDATSDLSLVRPLSSSERAQIQTFPEDFLFMGSKADVEQMIGNAVPVKLAEFVASRILAYNQRRSERLEEWGLS